MPLILKGYLRKNANFPYQNMHKSNDIISILTARHDCAFITKADAACHCSLGYRSASSTRSA
jgi:hypothetical protein